MKKYYDMKRRLLRKTYDRAVRRFNATTNPVRRRKRGNLVALLLRIARDRKINLEKE